MINTRIANGKGAENFAEVDSYNSVKVNLSEKELPAIGTQNRRRYYSETLSATNVDGSVTPQTFEIASDTTGEFDIIIQQIIMIMSDGTQSPAKYGALSALTNGVDLFIEEGGEITYLLEAAKTGGTLLVQSGLPNPFGSGTGVNVMSNWATNDDALVVTIDLERIVPGGLRLGRGVRDRFCFVVNDDLTGLSDQFLTFQGYKLYK